MEGDAPQPRAIERMVDAIGADLAELAARWSMREAVTLTVATGERFSDDRLPLYFTGDFTAPLVMVHLNPKHDPVRPRHEQDSRLRDPMEYVEFHRRFGHHTWGTDPRYRSRFDRKQVRFLRPFGLIDFLPEDVPGSDRENAERVIDRKLQLELIPYGSAGFPTHRFTGELLSKHLARVVSVAAAYPRQAVLLCGAVFDRLLQKHIVERDRHRFHLPTKAGWSRNQYRFDNVVLEHEGLRIAAGLAHSFAAQGLPMDAYGRRCAELLHAHAR